MPAPPESIDQQIVNQLLATVAVIGTPSTDWLTAPVQPIGEGSPADALPRTGDELSPPGANADLQIFLDHYQTTNRDQQDGTYLQHAWISRFRFWIVAKFTTDKPSFGRKTVRQAAADLWRALEGAEQTFATLSDDEGLDFGPLVFHRDMESQGYAAASIDVDVRRAQLHGAT